MRIISFFDTDQLTCASRQGLDFAEEARRRDHDVVAVGIFRGMRVSGLTPVGSLAEERRIPFRLVQKRFAFDVGALGQLDAMIRRLKPDLFQSFGWTSSVYGRAAWLKDIPWQALILESPAAGKPGTIWARLGESFTKKMIRRADQILIDSPPTGDELARRGVQREDIVCLQAAEGLNERSTKETARDATPNPELSAGRDTSHWTARVLEISERLIENR